MSRDRKSKKERGERGEGESEYNKVMMVRKKKPFLLKLLLFFLVNCSCRWPRNQLPQIQTHALSCHSSKLGQWQRYTGVTSKVPIASITLVQHWHLFSI